MNSSSHTSHSDSTNAPCKTAFQRIELIGQSSFFNRLLRDFLCDHALLPVEITTLDTCQPDDKTLLLINLQELAPKTLDSFLNRLQKQQPCCQVAILNLNKQTNTDALLNWPVVKGLLHGQANNQLLLKGIQALQKGEYWFSRRELNILARRRMPPPADSTLSRTLTNREQQILELLNEGLSNEEIAAQLFLSKHTIKTHLYNLYRKLGIKNRTQALKYYRQMN